MAAKLTTLMSCSVVLCKRKEKTAMDVISFRPIEDAA